MNKKNDDLNLKGPDAFQAKTASMIFKMRQHSKALVGVFILILVSIAGVIGLNFWSGQKSSELSKNLAEIEKVFQEEQESFDKKKQGVETNLDDLKLTMQKAKDPEKSELERQVNQLESQLKTMKPDHSNSMNRFKEFYESHPSDPEGWVAGIRFSSLLSEQEKLEEAKSVLEKIASQSVGYAIIYVQSKSMLISALEDLGKFDEAIQHAEQLEKNVGDQLKPQVLLTLGRLYLLKSDKEKAKTNLDQIIEKFSSSQEAEKARSMKFLL